MKHNACAVLAGVVFGFIIAWAQITDPVVIRRMLLLQEFDVFLLMGSAIVVAALGSRILRSAGARTLVSREPVQWTSVRPGVNHVAGSALFGVGWSVVGTCPGPAAAMIGEGRLSGLLVVAGILLGVLVHRGATKSSSTVPCGQQVPVGM